MNVLDALLIIAALWFAYVGYGQGFVVAATSVIGFLLGGWVAIQVLPMLFDPGEAGTLSSLLAVLGVLVVACVGQAAMTQLGSRLSSRLVRSGATKVVDSVGGAAVNVVALLLVAWMVGAPLAAASLPTVSREVRGSATMGTLQDVMPAQVDGWFDDFESLLARNGFPPLFDPFTPEQVTDVPPPDATLVASPAVEEARGSIVKVVGTAPSCGKVLEGTGFVFAPGRVMTNAHVVGGVDEPTVQIGGEGRLWDATVVIFDWQRDVAVLNVPGLDVPPLEFVEGAESGDDAIVAGFPENGAFDVRAARLRDRLEVRGPDIYQRGDVTREVYSLYALVRQGNSGGPLLSPEGDVYGVIFAKSLDRDDTGYALTIDEIRDVIELGRTAEQPVDTDACAM
ncbi:MarP family serine protease [Allostreptomyces psammosilenae]|uniref:S1-C subfamily serine protease n=1 Tax=Allostreptomyces psammosilenae TaxID=1892865 RepID=A0A852ZVE6_9ACTN|nr:MarP family serine protease [Allostreptomyces psammosilenae]NYI05607.1 S1-C subfamily serine protease [Allostreptomyces psammosilenae]